MTKEEFHAALRILSSLEYDELCDFIDSHDWPRFASNPWKFYVLADDEAEDKLWAIISRRLSIIEAHRSASLTD